jgi:hypothetical protein
MADDRTRRIRVLNDAFRTGERPELGRIMLTANARAAVAAWPLGEIALYQKVQTFTEFNDDNDPWHEHDFGSFEHAGETFFFKIDYLQRGSNYTAGAEHPEDPKTCERVMTIMLASDY